MTARNRPGADPWEHLEKLAQKQHRTVDDLWEEGRLTKGQLGVDPLAR